MSRDPEIDERERAALRAAYRTLQTERSESCPDAETLAALVVGDLEGEARARCANHVPTCRSCSDDYRSLAEIHARASTELRPRSPRRILPIAAAVAAALLAGALIFLRSERREEAFRGGAPASAAVAPADGATLAGPPSELRWPAQAGTESYRVKLFASSGDALWDADTRTVDRVALPETVRSRLRPGSYFWTVEVRLPSERQRLGPYSFTVGR